LTPTPFGCSKRTVLPSRILRVRRFQKCKRSLNYFRTFRRFVIQRYSGPDIELTCGPFAGEKYQRQPSGRQTSDVSILVRHAPGRPTIILIATTEATPTCSAKLPASIRCAFAAAATTTFTVTPSCGPTTTTILHSGGQDPLAGRKPQERPGPAGATGQPPAWKTPQAAVSTALRAIADMKRIRKAAEPAL
jgi:hypothetical protein